MPRISPRTFRTAFKINPHLARLLPVCRDLRSAQNELRWLRECVEELKILRRQDLEKPEAPLVDNGPITLSHIVGLRAKGTPLQYLFGSEYFGDLQIKCRPGVLIPRLVSHLISLAFRPYSILIRPDFLSDKKQQLQSNTSSNVSFRSYQKTRP